MTKKTNKVNEGLWDDVKTFTKTFNPVDSAKKQNEKAGKAQEKAEYAQKLKFVSSLTKYMDRIKRFVQPTTAESVVSKYASMYESVLDGIILEKTVRDTARGKAAVSRQQATNPQTQTGQNAAPNQPNQTSQNAATDKTEQQKQIEDKVEQFVKGYFQGYDWTQYQPYLEKDIKEFVAAYVAAGYKTPQKQAEDLFDLGMAAGAVQKRDYQGRVASQSQEFSVSNMQKWIQSVANQLRGSGDERNLVELVAGLMQMAEKENIATDTLVASAKKKMAANKQKQQVATQQGPGQTTQNATAESRNLRKNSV